MPLVSLLVNLWFLDENFSYIASSQPAIICYLKSTVEAPEKLYNLLKVK